MTTSIGIGSGIGFGGSIVNPMAIVGAANTKLRLRADLGVTLVSGETDAWADQSPNARHFTAASSGFRPAAPADEALLNGKKSILFSITGGRHLLNPNTGSYWDFLHNGSDFWLILVGVTSTTDAAGDDFFFATGSRGVPYGGLGVGARSRASPNGFTGLTRLYNASGLQQSTFGSAGNNVGAPFWISLSRDNSLATKNSMRNTNDASPANYNDSAGTRGGALFYGASLGCRDDIGLHCDGKICEVFASNNAPDAATRAAMRAYLVSRYGTPNYEP